MGIYATFSADGFATGFYDEAIHGKFKAKGGMIPLTAIAITNDQWRLLMNSPGRVQLVNGAIVDVEPAPPAASTSDVDSERDRRIAAGFIFDGKMYQAREQDLRNINGAAIAAAVAIMNGALPGDLRWADPSSDFKWIAADNSMTAMDSQTVIRFGQTAMGWISALTMAGRGLKDRVLAGETLNISEDALWPATTA